jgi:hypothetical protein
MMVRKSIKLSKKSKKLLDNTEEVFKNYDEYHKIYEELINLGYEYIDEDDEGVEELEENRATVKNINQKKLVSYFEGNIEFTANLICKYIYEVNKNKPNYPLLRKYLKSGNSNLKTLLLFGLEQNKSDITLLNSLGYFNQFTSILKIIIDKYLIACQFEQDLVKFNILIEDFYYHVHKFDYDVFAGLSLCVKDITKISLIRQRQLEIMGLTKELKH